MKINWKVRFKSKSFWLAVIPAFALVVQAVMALFGFEYNFDETVNKLIVIVNAVFVLLVILGVVNDPTTTGISDSDYAMTKETPKETPLVVDKYGNGQEFTERKD